MGSALIEGIRARIRSLRYGLLLVPGTIATGMLLLGIVLSVVEKQHGFRGFDLFFGGDADTARSVLTTIAGAVAGVTGVSFSITIVTLQLVSQQFSPRALRTFLADRVTQVTAGVFLGTFGYCLMVLRVVGTAGSDGEAFIPTVSVSVAMLLAFVALLVLLIFVHHMARVIQVSEISAEVARATLSSLQDLYPRPFGEREEDEDPEALVERWRRERAPHVVCPSRPGYVQSVNLDDLPKRLPEGGGRLHLCVAPGDFVGLHDPLAEVWLDDADDVDIDRLIRSVTVVASSRDVFQDPLYGIRQLADIATRAISPSINDPSTAWTNIRYIESIVVRVAGRAFPPRVRRYPRSGREVVAAVRRSPFEEYLEVGFVQIGRYAQDARVAGAMLDALAAIGDAAARAGAVERLRPVRETARTIAEPALEAAPTERDRDEIRVRVARVMHPAGV